MSHMIYSKHKIIKKIKDGVFLIVVNGDKYLMKKPRIKHGVSITRQIRNYRAFKTELNLLSRLKSNSYYKVPNIIETDYKTYYILDYFESFEKDLIYEISLVESILKYNIINGSIIDQYLYSKTILLTFISLSKALSLIGIKNYLSICKSITLNNLSIKVRKTVLIHGDLRRGYNIRYANNTAYYIDFESNYIEKKYVLYDIVNFSNDVSNGFFYKINISHYLKIYNQGYESIKKNEELKIVYLCLLRSLLVNMSSFNTDKNNVIYLIIKYFVNYHEFSKWYSNNQDVLLY